MFNSSCCNQGGGYSLSDIAAVSRSNGSENDGFGGNGAWWIIILFLFVFCGWGGNGWGNGRNSGGNDGCNCSGGSGAALTRADLCQDMNFSQLENGVRGISQGLCDGFYAMNTNTLNGFAGVNSAVCSLGYTMAQGFNDVTMSGVQNTNALQQSLNTMNMGNMQNMNTLQAQIAQCCCDNRAGQKDIEYQLATNTCAVQNTIQNVTRDLIENQNNNTKSLMDFLVNDKISQLQSENDALRLAASQARQNNTIIEALRQPCPIPAYFVPNPNCCYQNQGCCCNNF